MAYLELFERAANHIHRKRAKLLFQRGNAMSAAEISRLIENSSLPIPDSLRAFYAEIGNGLHFAWEHPKKDCYASLEVPPLEEVAIPSLDSIRWRREWDDQYDFRYCKDANRAKKTALYMRRWIAIDTDGSGSRICLDGNLDPAPVVFDQHAWFDGGDGNNGHVLGSTLLDFLDNWSRVCVQFPRTNWWPSVFTHDGVNWISEKFDSLFRVEGP